MSQYEHLANFLGCYFHQDWHDEFATFESAVRAFVGDNAPEVVRVALSEARVLLEDPAFTTDPVQTLLELGCYLEPSYAGLTPSVWMTAVAAILSESLPSHEKDAAPSVAEDWDHKAGPGP